MILITRPKEQSINLKYNLEKKGYNVFQESFYKLQYLKKQISYDPNIYYIFPSIHAVKSLKKSNQILKFKNSNMLVIGEQVKKLLKASGCKNIIVITPDSSAMLKIMSSSKYNKKKYIYLCSNIINEDFFTKAYKKKINIQKKIVYKTVGVKNITKKLIESFELNKIKGVVFYSQFSVEIYIKLLAKYKVITNSKSIKAYCLSERIAKPLRYKNIDDIYVSKKPDERSLISTIKKRHFYNR
ncbi:uroporphyrinogen-III synthase [Pelagibacteraceae bacterium]|nr:uroporphyrinogen-III synthase [Pelagibacteraceae bacterium]